MPTAFPSTTDFASILTQAATAVRHGHRDRPSAQTVVAALLQAEKAAKQQRILYPLDALLGDWQLCFTAPRKAHFKGETLVGKGFYIPQFAPAQISFTPAIDPPGDLSADSASPSPHFTINNQVKLGQLILRFSGVAQYPGKKNLLAFEFTYLRLSLFDRTLYQQAFRSRAAKAKVHTLSIANLPFFAFFWVTETTIAARGRGGGVALWVRKSTN